NRAMVDGVIEAFTRDKTRAFLFEDGQRHRVPVSPVNTPAEFLEAEGGGARRFVQELADHAVGRLKTVAAPFLIDGKRPDPQLQAPRLGQHNWEFYVEETKVLSGTELDYLFAAGAV